MEWFVSHWDEILLAITSVIAAASAIANLTPTDADNKVVDAISKFVDTLALNFKK
ncbi:hypothetical protein V5G24_23055 [Xanthobacter sp. VTT E-85241]|uniref:hypothetical protein n=1 Tax=Roseixanthobacter finlandensis TaxID=3119922 RepID=UPI003728B21D